jgi:hypothetical protein
LPDFRLLPALDELSHRRIEDPVAACRILLEASKTKGPLLPVSELISELLSSLSNQNDECSKMIEEYVQGPRYGGFIACLPGLIARLNDARQAHLAPALVRLLTNSDEDLASAKAVMLALETISGEPARLGLARLLGDHLKDPNPTHLLIFTMAAARIGREESLEFLLNILDKSAKGWYAPYSKEIQTEICGYLLKVPNERAATALLSILSTGYRYEVVKAIVAISNKSVVDMLLDVIEVAALEHLKGSSTSAWQVASDATFVLSEVDPSLVDFKRLLSMPGLFELGASARNIQILVVKSGKPVVPLLMKLLTSSEIATYTFALQCLNQMGVSLEEESSAFEPPPIVQLVDFFFRLQLHLGN